MTSTPALSVCARRAQDSGLDPSMVGWAASGLFFGVGLFDIATTEFNGRFPAELLPIAILSFSIGVFLLLYIATRPSLPDPDLHEVPK